MKTRQMQAPEKKVIKKPFEKDQTQKSFALKVFEFSFLITGVSMRGVLFSYDPKREKKIKPISSTELDYLRGLIKNNILIDFILQKWKHIFKAKGKINSINPRQQQINITLHFPYKMNFKEEFFKLLNECFLNAFNNRTKNSPFVIFTIDNVIVLKVVVLKEQSKDLRKEENAKRITVSGE